MAKKMVNFLNDDGSTVAIETNAPDTTADVPTEPRLRKVPGKVNDDGLYIIKQALTLKAAVLSRMDCAPGGDAEEQGNLLVMICREWLAAESARLSAKG